MLHSKSKIFFMFPAHTKNKQTKTIIREGRALPLPNCKSNEFYK